VLRRGAEFDRDLGLSAAGSKLADGVGMAHLVCVLNPLRKLTRAVLVMAPLALALAAWGV
jgi:hypothetical protein